MNLTKHLLFSSIVTVVCVLGWSGCYTQLATSSDSPESENNSSITVTDQLPPTTVIIVNPVVEPIPESNYPHPWYPPLPPASMSTGNGAEAPAESPHRQSGYQRSPSNDQNNSQQTDAAPSRTSWNPAPASTPSAPNRGSDSGTRTSGSTRGGR